MVDGEAGSVPPIGGPNEEVNPLDGMLAALIACSMYIYEAVGIEQDIAIGSLSATVQGEINGRGNHWIYDSVPSINRPNEEVNPLDALVGALPA